MGAGLEEVEEEIVMVVGWRVESTNSGEGIWVMCERKVAFQGAGGEALGGAEVEDIVWRRWVRRRVDGVCLVRDAMIAVVSYCPGLAIDGLYWSKW